MKKGLFVLCSVVLVLTIIGCACSDVYTTKKDRVDVEVRGNQGVIYGPVPQPHQVANPQREMYAVDIELPTTGELKSAVKEEAGEEKASTVISEPQEPAAARVEKKAEKIK